jgi:hypothetical protein
MTWRNVRRNMARPWVIFGLGSILAALVYWPGLSGSWLFDDYPNIVDNTGVHARNWSIASLVSAALSSPASDFKRPLASLSFAVNYLITGANAPAMKFTNLCIHLLNGLAAFLFLRALLGVASNGQAASATNDRKAALIATAWLVLPINLTSVLYVVQRMESMANLAVMLGLWGYVTGRRRMLDGKSRGFLLAAGSVLSATAIGALAKETAIMLPLYAFLIEWYVLHRRRTSMTGNVVDRRITVFFLVFLLIPMIAGAAWLLPGVLNPSTWATRDFTLPTRLLSEARIVLDYIAWTLIPTPGTLSFYHDDFVVSQGLFSPATTLLSLVGVAIMLGLALWMRRRLPLAGLGIALFFGCHLLTGTVLPLELVYEHRNYFPSLGLLLSLVTVFSAIPSSRALAQRLGQACFVFFALLWIFITWSTAEAWGNPLSLARELAFRAPDSPRAQYELGRTYIIYSNYDAVSPFIPLAYQPLERAARLPGSSILPEQALIFMTSRMHLPVEDAWWQSIEVKLKARPATVQDESSLDALAQCLRQMSCDFSPKHLFNAFGAALSHDRRSPRLLAMYAAFAWETMKDKQLAYRVQQEAVAGAPRENAYRIGLARYAVQLGDRDELARQISRLRAADIGGNLDADLRPLQDAYRRMARPVCISQDSSCTP